MPQTFPSRRFLIAALGVFAALKLVYLLASTPHPDELYYWMWGQYPALSYFDHPPMLAWVQRLSQWVFGWNLFAVRAPGLLSFAATLFVVAFWFRRLAPARGDDALLLSALLLLASPLFFVFQTIAYPDHLLFAFAFLAVHFFALFVSGDDGKPRPAWLYGAAVAAGCAGLSKYNAVFVGIGFAGWFLTTSRGRAMLATPHPWLAGGLALAIVSPVMVWNMQHDWASFRYNLDDRISVNFDRALPHLATFLGAAGLTFSLFLLPALVRFLFANVEDQRFRAFQAPGRIAFWSSTAVFTFLATLGPVHFYWNAMSVAFAMPVLLLFVANAREFRGHAILGIALNAVIVFSYVVIPVTTLFGMNAREVNMTYGWPEVGEAVERAEAQYGPDLILAEDWRLAASLGFTMQRRDVISIGPATDQYDFWFDRGDFAGRSALILVGPDPADYAVLRPIRDALEPAGEIVVKRLGYELGHMKLFFLDDAGLIPVNIPERSATCHTSPICPASQPRMARLRVSPQ